LTYSPFVVVCSIGCTALWSKKYLDMLNERKIDSLKDAAAKKNKKLPAIKTTKAQRMRDKYNEQVSAAVVPAATLSYVDAFADSDSWSGHDSVFGTKANEARSKLR
jgi:predicted NAD/FAD-dependent oxidoreductase